MILCDSGPLYAILNRRDRHSARCRTALAQLTEPLLTTWPCFTEAMYFAYDAGGWPMQNALWELVRRGELRLQVPDEGTEVRMQELMEQYRDTPMDLADASLVVAAELLGSSRIFTTDSDFYVYRRNGNLPFEVLP